MYAKIAVSLLVGSVLFLGADGASAATTTTEHDFQPIPWDFQGKPVPETHWSPWLPVGVQAGLRFKLGFRFSDGTISIRCPVHTTFKYDPATAKSGSDFRIKVKAETIGSDNDTFSSAFGICLPNVLQIGLVDVTGLPIDLPWFDLPLDFWDMIAQIPKVGANISSAASNIGVNTGTQDALPLGKSETYHDQRDLISFDLTDKSPADLAPALFNKIPESVRTNAVRAVKLANMVSDAEAIDIIQTALETAISVIYDAPNLTLSADPYYVVEGVRLRLNVKCFIPNGKGSGDYTLYFDRPNQEQEINFRDITPFVDDGDKINIVVDNIAYEFRVKQGLTATVKLSVIPIDLETVEKVVTYHTAELTLQDGFKIEVPLQKNTDTLQSMHVHPGVTSVSVNWASPTTPLKGIVTVYDSRDRLIKTVQENTFKNNHNVIVTELQKGTAYSFGIECLSSGGQRFSGGTLETTTRTDAPTRYTDMTCNDLSMTAQPSVIAGLDTIDFSWTTNIPASTEVLYSPSPDLAVNHIGAVKKKNGTVVQGWVTQGGNREFVTNHSIRITDLEPGVKYYYNVASWTFGDPDNEIDPKDCVGFVSNITTDFIPMPSVKAKALYDNVGVPDIPIVVTKVGSSSYRTVTLTDTHGVSALVTLDKANASYLFSVKGHPAYQDATSQPLGVSASTQGELPTVMLPLVCRPSPGGYVYDTQGNPIQGATVKIVNYAQYQTTTDNNGHYTFPGDLPFTGNALLDVSKQDYVTRRVTGLINRISYANLLSVDGCILPSAIATVNITAKTQGGSAVRNATILIKEGGTQRGSVTTNTRGLATFTCNFNDNNANEHNLTFELQPPTGTKIMAVSTSLPILGGSQQPLDLTCVEDNQGPAISNFVLKQIGAHNINATFSLNDPTATASLAYQDPQGRAHTTDWNTGAVDQASGASFHHRIIQGNGIDPGTYRIKVKAKDALDNVTEGSFVDFVLFGGPLWNLKAMNIAQNSALLRWDRFPPDNEASFNKFGKHVLKVGDQTPIEIPNADTTSYTVRSLSANTTYTASIHVVMANSPGYLTVPGTTSLKTPSNPPVISDLTVQPSLLLKKENIQVAATITDPDTNVKKVTLVLNNQKEKKDLTRKTYNANSAAFSYTFKIDQPGDYTLMLVAEDEAGAASAEKKIAVLDIERPKIVFAKVPSRANVGDGITAAIRITNADSLKGELACDINWGDGTEETLPIGGKRTMESSELKNDRFELAHTYENDGAFTITATVNVAVEKVKIASDPISKTITIRSVAAAARLTKKSKKNTVTFHIKATQGSYPITAWTLDFGDEVKESGQGEVDKDMTHLYLRKGEYAVKFDVVDSKNNVASKTTSLKMRNDAQPGESIVPPPSGGTLQEPGENKRDEVVTGDLSIVELRGHVAQSDKPTTADVTIKNDGEKPVAGVAVALTAGSTRAEPQQVDLKAGETKTLTFRYTPTRAGALTLVARITPPKGFKDSNSRNNRASQRITVE